MIQLDGVNPWHVHDQDIAAVKDVFDDIATQGGARPANPEGLTMSELHLLWLRVFPNIPTDGVECLKERIFLALDADDSGTVSWEELLDYR
eukprot:gene39203-46576_t